MKKYAIVDIDGTMFDATHRVGLAHGGSWDEFHQAASQDPPFEDTLQFLREFDERGYRIICCTGRPERYRQATIDQFIDANIASEIEEILMRPDADWSKDHDLKVKLVDDFFGSREKALEQVLFVLDDRDKVVEAFRNAGYWCLQARQGTY